MLLPPLGDYASLVPFLIGFILFLNFLELRIDFRRLLPKELLVTLFLTVVVMPVLAYYVLGRGFDNAYRIGLLLTACAPAGVMTIILGHYIKEGDYYLVFSNFMVATFGSILYIPIVLACILGKSVEIEIRPVVAQTAALVIIPFSASRIAFRFFPSRMLQWLKSKSGRFTLVIAFCVVAISVAAPSQELQWDLSLLFLSAVILGVFLLPGSLAYLVGNLFGGVGTRNTLSFVASSRNVQLVLAIAILNFPPLTTVPIIIGIFIHHVVNAFWLWLYRVK